MMPPTHGRLLNAAMATCAYFVHSRAVTCLSTACSRSSSTGWITPDVSLSSSFTTASLRGEKPSKSAHDQHDDLVDVRRDGESMQLFRNQPARFDDRDAVRL